MCNIEYRKQLINQITKKSNKGGNPLSKFNVGGGGLLKPWWVRDLTIIDYWSKMRKRHNNKSCLKASRSIINYR